MKALAPRSANAAEFLAIVGHHADRLAGSLGRPEDGVDGVAHHRRIAIGRPESDGQVAPADEDGIQPLDCEDRIDPLQGGRVLDHGHGGNSRVGRIDQVPHLRAAIAPRTGDAGEAALAAPVAAGRDQRLGIGDRGDMGREHALGAAIEHGEDRVGRKRGNTDDPGDAGGPRRQQRDIGRVAIEGRVFLVDDDEIEAAESEDLGRMGGRRLDEAPGQEGAAEQALAEAVRCGSLHDATCRFHWSR